MDIKPLTFGTLKQHKDVVDAYLAPLKDGDTVFEVTARAAAFLALAVPDDLDALAPREITTSAMAVFRATFNRPEESAPADPAALSTGAISQG
jgi:hypothetical protein